MRLIAGEPAILEAPPSSGHSRAAQVHHHRPLIRANHEFGCGDSRRRRPKVDSHARRFARLERHWLAARSETGVVKVEAFDRDRFIAGVGNGQELPARCIGRYVAEVQGRRAQGGDRRNSACYRLGGGRRNTAFLNRLAGDSDARRAVEGLGCTTLGLLIIQLDGQCRARSRTAEFV